MQTNSPVSDLYLYKNQATCLRSLLKQYVFVPGFTKHSVLMLGNKKPGKDAEALKGTLKRKSDSCIDFFEDVSFSCLLISFEWSVSSLTVYRSAGSRFCRSLIWRDYFARNYWRRLVLQEFWLQVLLHRLLEHSVMMTVYEMLKTSLKNYLLGSSSV